MSLDATKTLSRVDLPYSTMAATEAADKSAAAAAVAASSSSSSTGFDLINHAIRMGTSAAKPITPMDASSNSESANSVSNSELLLKAHLLDRVSATNPISRVSSTSSNVGPVLSHHELASASQPYANLVRQQLGGGSIVAALQRRHSQPSLAELPPGLSMQLASFIGAAAAAATPATSKTIVPPSSPTPIDARQTQDEQNARQLNPNAFQFPWKLHDMLDRSSTEGYDDVVSWVDNGEAFRVHLPDVFVENVMSRFFKQTKYKSFQRQLNLYGFTRLHNGPNKGGYKHKYFRQGQRTMCQLITRCPVRDSSSAAAAIATTAATEDTRMVVEEDTSSSAPIPALPHAISNASIASKTPISSLKPKQPQSQSQADAYHQAAAMLAARQQAITSSYHIIEKARQEQLQQLQLQQLEAHRLQQLNLQHKQQREIPLTSSYVPGMPLAGTDHSAYPSRQLSVSRSSSVSPTPGSTVLDASNSSSLGSEGQDSAAAALTQLSDKEKLSMFHKEFQFPWKLYEMLERANEEDFSNLVSWQPGDSSFKVHDAENFVKTVMPRFFKQTKYKSFQRQLNLYGFTRVDTGPNKGGYRHLSFRKGRKDLLVNINRIKIKGNGRPRGSSSNSSTAIITDSDSSDNNVNRVTQHNPVPPTATTMTNPEQISGIDVILKAIKAKEGTEAAPANSNVVSDVTDSTSDSNSTIPSTIDVQMKESTSDSKNGYGLSWRQNPSESFSDWTIEVIEEDNKIAQPSSGKCAIYHVHRRVLAVGPKKSDYFANIFKSNGSANRSQLRLSKKEAAVFPLALDFIYADIDFDLDTEKAYALYSLGQRLKNTTIVQTVTEFYSKWCMTNSNVVDFIKLGQGFENKTLLEAAVLKCSQEIWFMDVEQASKIDPGLLLRILVIATSMARNQETREYDSSKLSQMVAISVSHASTVTLTIEIFRSLTNKAVLPTLDPIAAIELLATENTLLSLRREGQITVSDDSFHQRCVSAIQKNWGVVRKRLSESTELANAMRSIPSMVLYEVLMQTTSSQ